MTIHSPPVTVSLGFDRNGFARHSTRYVSSCNRQSVIAAFSSYPGLVAADFAAGFATDVCLTIGFDAGAGALLLLLAARFSSAFAARASRFACARNTSQHSWCRFQLSGYEVGLLQWLREQLVPSHASSECSWRPCRTQSKELPTRTQSREALCSQQSFRHSDSANPEPTEKDSARFRQFPLHFITVSQFTIHNNRN